MRASCAVLYCTMLSSAKQQCQQNVKAFIINSETVCTQVNNKQFHQFVNIMLIRFIIFNNNNNHCRNRVISRLHSFSSVNFLFIFVLNELSWFSIAFCCCLSFLRCSQLSELKEMQRENVFLFSNFIIADVKRKQKTFCCRKKC